MSAMMIFVKTQNSNDKTIALQVKQSDTIESVKQQIQDHCGIPADLIRLTTLGSKTLKAGFTLEDFGVNHESTLCVHYQFSSKYSLGPRLKHCDRIDPETFLEVVFDRVSGKLFHEEIVIAFQKFADASFILTNFPTASKYYSCGFESCVKLLLKYDSAEMTAPNIRLKLLSSFTTCLSSMFGNSSRECYDVSLLLFSTFSRVKGLNGTDISQQISSCIKNLVKHKDHLLEQVQRDNCCSVQDGILNSLNALLKNEIEHSIADKNMRLILDVCCLIEVVVRIHGEQLGNFLVSRELDLWEPHALAAWERTVNFATKYSFLFSATAAQNLLTGELGLRQRDATLRNQDEEDDDSDDDDDTRTLNFAVRQFFQKQSVMISMIK